MTLVLGQWHFPVTDAWTVIGLSVLAAATAWAIVAAWKRLGRRAPVRWALVAALNLAAAIALFAWLVPPERPIDAEGVARLLTEGTRDARQFDDPLTFALPDVVVAARGVTRLAVPAQLPLRRPGIGTLRVEGHGLHANQWASLPRTMAVDYAPPPLEGLVEPSWPRRLALGQALAIGAGYVAPTPDVVATVSLVDPAGVTVAETSVRSGARFELVARPRARGLTTYQLRLTRGDVTLETAPVAVEVGGGEPVEIGVIQSAPSFETRHLQHWAGSHGSQVSIRSRISRDRTLDQGVNTDPSTGETLTPQWLATLDLLVMDGRSWSDLDTARKGVVEAAVRSGLGLLILADDAFEPTAWLERYTLVRDETPVESVVPVLPGHDHDIALPVLGRRLETSEAAVLTAAENGETLEAWHGDGLGRVAVSVLRERHRWQTAGRGDLYSAYWANILRTLARPGDGAELGAPSPDRLARPRLKHQACVVFNAPTEPGRAPGDGLVRFSARGGQGTASRVAFNALAGPVGCVETWPLAPGWHTVTWRPDDTALPAATGHEYVFAEQDWQTADRYARQVATRARAAEKVTGNGTGAAQARKAMSPTVPWWLFVFFAVLLWIERKQDAMR